MHGVFNYRGTKVIIEKVDLRCRWPDCISHQPSCRGSENCNIKGNLGPLHQWLFYEKMTLNHLTQRLPDSFVISCNERTSSPWTVTLRWLKRGYSCPLYGGQFWPTREVTLTQLLFFVVQSEFINKSVNARL